MTTTNLAKRVERGAKFLDRKRKDWAASVDLTRLDILDGHRCILGQTDGSYWDHAAQLGLMVGTDDKKATAMGFNLDEKDYMAKNASVLEEAWAIEVAKRQLKYARKNR